MSEILKITGFLVTVDIEKAFDSVNHVFLSTILKKFGFSSEFVKWISILLKNQESCVINGGKTSKYFKLARGTRQGDPISAYLFIIVLEVVFLIINKRSSIKGLGIFNKTFVYTAYADDTTFFLKDKNSIRNLLEVFKDYSCFSGLKPNKSKCEIAGIGILKGVNVALCGMKCINLDKDTIKILGIHHSYNKNLENDENFKQSINKIENVLKLWRSRYLSLEGKVVIFKSLAFSQIVHLALVKSVPVSFIDELNKIQKNFIWNGRKPKIKSTTFNSNFECGGLKSLNISAKINSLQCSWIKRLFDKNFHDWKIVPLFIIEKYLGKYFKFHSNLQIRRNLICKFPTYYQNVINNWSKNLSNEANVPSTILSQFLWFNRQIQIGGATIYFSDFSNKYINFVRDLFHLEGGLKRWEFIQEEYHLPNNAKFKWMQLVHAIPKFWKEEILSDKGNSNNLIIQEHHIIKKHQVCCLAKLNSKEIYNILISSLYRKPTSQSYFEHFFGRNDFEWKRIYVLPRIVTKDSRLRLFQFKILHNILYLNEKLFDFRIVTSPECSFCMSEEETVIHLFYHCRHTQLLWNQLTNFFSNCLTLPQITPQSAIFGFLDIVQNIFLITNHLLIIFKNYIYNARKYKVLRLDDLISIIKEIHDNEKAIAETNQYQKRKYDRKWNAINRVFDNR